MLVVTRESKRLFFVNRETWPEICTFFRENGPAVQKSLQKRFFGDVLKLRELNTWRTWQPIIKIIKQIQQTVTLRTFETFHDVIFRELRNSKSNYRDSWFAIFNSRELCAWPPLTAPQRTKELPQFVVGELVSHRHVLPPNNHVTGYSGGEVRYRKRSQRPFPMKHCLLQAKTSRGTVAALLSSKFHWQT